MIGLFFHLTTKWYKNVCLLLDGVNIDCTKNDDGQPFIGKWLDVGNLMTLMLDTLFNHSKMLGQLVNGSSGQPPITKKP